MPAMDHYSGDVHRSIVGVPAQLALVLINELTNKLLDLIMMRVLQSFHLLEEVCCWVLKFFHLNIDILT